MRQCRSHGRQAWGRLPVATQRSAPNARVAEFLGSWPQSVRYGPDLQGFNVPLAHGECCPRHFRETGHQVQRVLQHVEEPLPDITTSTADPHKPARSSFTVEAERCLLANTPGKTTFSRNTSRPPDPQAHHHAPASTSLVPVNHLPPESPNQSLILT